MKKTITSIITILLLLAISTISYNKSEHNHIHADSANCPECGAPGEYVRTDSDANCVSGGQATYECINRACPKHTPTAGNYFTVTTPAKGHSYNDTVKDATCTEDGYIHHECSRCHETYDEVIPAKGHYYQYTIITKPTCTEEGLYRYKCIRCTSSFDKTVDALGHSYTEIENVEPTCTEDGHKTIECKNCGDKKTETIKALGHDVTLTTTKEPTCTEAGEKSGICKTCNEEIKEVIPAIGHKYSDDWTIDKEATIFSQGEKSHICENCGEVEKAIIEKKPVPPAVPIAIGGTALAGVALLILKKTGVIGAKKAAKKVAEEAIRNAVEKEALKPSFEEKTMVTCMKKDNSLYKAMKVQKYIQVVESEYDDLADAISENEPALTIIDISDKDLEEVKENLEEIKKDNDSSNISLLVNDHQLKNQKDLLEQMKKDKTIKNYGSIYSNCNVNLVKLVLPAMKPKLNSDESLENIGMVADALNIPGISTIINAYIAGREIKETVESSEGKLGVVDKATIISDLASILGLEKVSSVAGLVGDVDDIKSSLEAKKGGFEARTTKDAATDIVDVVKDIIDK